jgi:hypothetical protein
MECSIQLGCRLVEWNIPSFTSWKYSYHWTNKHSLFVYYLVSGKICLIFTRYYWNFYYNHKILSVLQDIVKTEKTSTPPHGGNWKLTPLPNTLTIIRNNFSPLPLRTVEISFVGGVWIWNDPLKQNFCTGNVNSTLNRQQVILWQKVSDIHPHTEALGTRLSDILSKYHRQYLVMVD